MLEVRCPQVTVQVQHNKLLENGSSNSQKQVPHKTGKKPRGSQPQVDTFVRRSLNRYIAINRIFVLGKRLSQCRFLYKLVSIHIKRLILYNQLNYITYLVLNVSVCLGASWGSVNECHLFYVLNDFYVWWCLGQNILSQVWNCINKIIKEILTMYSIWFLGIKAKN